MAATTQSMDALELKIKALRDESRVLQTTIEQLSDREKSHTQAVESFENSMLFGLFFLLLSAAALVLGRVLLRRAWQRVRVAMPADTADFRESEYRFRSSDAYHPPDDAPMQAPTPAYTPVVERRASLSDVADVDVDLDLAPTEDVFVAPEPTPELYADATAIEIQRVRSSLAEKRNARELRTLHRAQLAATATALATAAAHVADQHVIALTKDEPSPDDFAVALDLDLDLDISVVSQLEVPVVSIPDAAPEPEPEPEPVALPLIMEEVVETPSEGDDQVKLELAREFMLLGLLDGARELAMEYMASTDATLHTQSIELISQIEQLEQRDRMEQQEKERARQAELEASAVPEALAAPPA